MSKHSPFIGAHYSIAKGFAGAFSAAHKDGATALQIFAKSPMQAKYRSVHPDEAAEVSALPFRASLGCTVIHASYLINLAKPEAADSFSIRSVVEDLQSSDALHAQGVVLHMGKSLERKLSDAEDTYEKNIRAVIAHSKDSLSPLLLENTAGQGTEMGWNLDSYVAFLKRFKDTPRVKSCIDTAHLFAAGENIEKDPKGVAHKLIDLLGTHTVVAVHLNDSKKECGSRVDRHEDIGYGAIGEKSLATFVRELHTLDPHIAFILETPQTSSTYREQIETVTRWF